MMTLLVLLVFLFNPELNPAYVFGDPIDHWLVSFERELNELNTSWYLREQDRLSELKDLEFCLSAKEYTVSEKFSFLLQLRELEKEIQSDKAHSYIDKQCFRYQKGLEVLKMIYEKVLSLDHHFASMVSYQEIANMCNINAYPEMINFKEELLRQSKRRQRLQIPEVLENNPLITMAYTVFFSISGRGRNNSKSEEMEDLACLLDFGISMQSELKIILYETEYLKKQNETLKELSLDLFDNYVKLLDYKYGMEYCRSEDDWDVLKLSLSGFKQRLLGRNNVVSIQEDEDLNQLRFSIDQLIGFLDSYNDFVYDAEMYYQKFYSIIINYANLEECSHALPESYDRLTEDILVAIDKFQKAYKIAELKGSKLKELLYGLPVN